jgi:hypothetical protein
LFFKTSETRKTRSCTKEKAPKKSNELTLKSQFVHFLCYNFQYSFFNCFITTVHCSEASWQVSHFVF